MGFGTAAITDMNGRGLARVRAAVAGLVRQATDIALPPLSRRTFARALWAVRGAASRYGVPF